MLCLLTALLLLRGAECILNLQTSAKLVMT